MAQELNLKRLLEDTRAELIAANAAHMTEIGRRERAESESAALRNALRSLLATLPNEWAPHEVQMARMLCREMVKS